MLDWEDWGEKENARGSHGSHFHETIGKPFGDLCLDDLENGRRKARVGG